MSDAPTILIHGILGSQLVQTYDNSFDTIWSGIQKGYESILDLELNPTGKVEKDPRDLIAVSRIESLAYSELLGRLRRALEAPCYVFRYDWRLDNGTSAQELGEFVERVQLKTGASRVQVVAHSMGALVFAALLKQRQELLPLINRAVLAAPPFLGAAEAVRTLLVGQSRIIPVNASDAFRKIARSFPSTYQLVPGYKGAFVHHRADYTDEKVWMMAYWQRRTRFEGRKRKDYEVREALMQRHLTRARQFQQSELLDFDQLPLKERRRFLLLFGSGEKTLERITVLPRNSKGDIANFFEFDDPSNIADGDGTVPVISAKRFSKLPSHEVNLANHRKWWNPFSWDDSLKIGLAGFHGGFVALDKVQSIILAFLQGYNPKPSWSEPIRA